MRRIALGSVITAAVLLAAGLAVALSSGSAPRPAGHLLVRGRVTAADGRPVAGIKVWLNAQPTASVVRALTAARQPVYVTVVTSAYPRGP
jgi:phage I-like protein